MQDYKVLESGALAGGYHSAAQGPAKQKPALIFVDPSAIAVSALIVTAAEKQSDLIFLSAAQDGLEQVAWHLSGRARLSLIHLLADFSLGRLKLGNKVLVVRSLRDDATRLTRIGRAVRGGGQIVIGAGAHPDGQGDNFRRAFEGYAAVPVRLWDGAALRRS
jgi:hypothetical protein